MQTRKEMIEEQAQNAERVVKMQALINSDDFKAIDSDEQRRLYRQCALMRELEVVQLERIAALKPQEGEAAPVVLEAGEPEAAA